MIHIVHFNPYAGIQNAVNFNNDFEKRVLEAKVHGTKYFTNYRSIHGDVYVRRHVDLYNL